MGVEFFAAVVGFTLMGYWLGEWRGWNPTSVLVGAGLGIIGGGYNLIRHALGAVRDSRREDEEQGGPGQ
jgi:F0F1-type ATP synthase assembly protein I